MSAVFPESMNRLNKTDVAGSLTTVENYIGYMRERVEFAMRNMTRSVSEAGVSTVEILLLVQELATAVSTMQSTVSGMTGTINETNARIDTVNETIQTMQEQLTALAERVTALESAGTEG